MERTLSEASRTGRGMPRRKSKLTGQEGFSEQIWPGVGAQVYSRGLYTPDRFFTNNIANRNKSLCHYIHGRPSRGGSIGSNTHFLYSKEICATIGSVYRSPYIIRNMDGRLIMALQCSLSCPLLNQPKITAFMRYSTLEHIFLSCIAPLPNDGADIR